MVMCPTKQKVIGLPIKIYEDRELLPTLFYVLFWFERLNFLMKIIVVSVV